ncbi:hypothetical protein A0257_21970 [Hymenobacter psoromatis]|nr:hypothetical protein A0257_21970 [Hymenobacter psoromatis]
MEPKFNAATPQRPAGDRLLDAPLLLADISSLVEQLHRESIWEESDRNAITVFKTAGLTIVLVILRVDAILNLCISEGLLSLHLLKGQVQVVADSAEPLPALSQGQLLTLHAGAPYRALALAEATLLLTVAGQTRPPEAGGPPYLLRLAEDANDIGNLLG